MTKEEIEQELVRARATETTIKNEIIELLEQLVESEKPKLGHGDFGYTKDGWIRVRLFDVAKPDRGKKVDYNPYGRAAVSEFEPLGFNIFDLLKEWSEPFEEWHKDEMATGIKIEDDGRISAYFCTGADCTKENNRCHFEIERAEEIWHALGKAIAMKKRQQAK